MNLILITEEDFVDAYLVTLSDRRHRHIVDVHRAVLGDRLRVGLIGAQMGFGEVLQIDHFSLTMRVDLTDEAPPPLDLTLFLALPRPKLLARCLQTATTLGVKQIFLVNSVRVEKVYWSCAQLEPAEIRKACIIGLEQARDTILPEVHLRRLFKPFVEDELPALIKASEAFVAHPGAVSLCPRGVEKSVALAIGPEGGFIDYEIEKLSQAGLRPVRTLERIMKVETAIAALIGRLM